MRGQRLKGGQVATPGLGLISDFLITDRAPAGDQGNDGVADRMARHAYERKYARDNPNWSRKDL